MMARPLRLIFCCARALNSGMLGTLPAFAVSGPQPTQRQLQASQPSCARKPAPPQDPFSDPSQASLTCLANKPVTVRDEAAIAGAEGKEIFSERKGLNLFQNKVSCYTARG